ncbi:unnamed protein product, partial [Prorocentrum cordatum]
SCSSAPLAKPAASKHPEMRGRLRIGCRYQWRGGRPRQAPARTSSCASEPGTPPRDARVPLGTVDRWTQCQTGMTHSAGVSSVNYHPICVVSLSSPVASRQLGHEARARGGTAPGRRRRSEGRSACLPPADRSAAAWADSPRHTPKDASSSADHPASAHHHDQRNRGGGGEGGGGGRSGGQHFTSRSSEAYRSPTELSAHSGRQPGRQLALPKNGLWVEWSLLARRWSTISSLGDRWERGRERARNNRRGRREGGLR